MPWIFAIAQIKYPKRTNKKILIYILLFYDIKRKAIIVYLLFYLYLWCILCDFITIWFTILSFMLTAEDKTLQGNGLKVKHGTNINKLTITWNGVVDTSILIVLLMHYMFYNVTLYINSGVLYGKKKKNNFDSWRYRDSAGKPMWWLNTWWTLFNS